nr:prostamide/prostaglandin F synthase [Tanacetum cinerariifolium]
MFKKTKPVDDMENLLFQTLKTMFEPHVEDIIWKYQQGAVKVNTWKLFNSCGVYCVTTKTMVYYLLVEDVPIYKQCSTSIMVRCKALVNAAYIQLVLLVYKVDVFNKVNAAKSRVTTAVRVSTAGWLKWLEEQDMQVNEIYYETIFSSLQSPSSQLNQSLFSNNIACSLSLSSHRKSNQSVVPKASSTATYSPEIGDVLGSVDIFTASGESVLFNDLWDQSEGIAVVALLRHFGCPCCWELASTLEESLSKFEAAGVKLIAIGIGEPKKARVFAERLSFPLDSLYTDPERKAYNLLGLYYGIGRTFFNPASAKVLTKSRFEALKKATENYTIEVTPDDRGSVLQQGGMFVFKGKELLYAWKDEGTGDHAPLDDIFSICCKTPVA